MVNDCVKNVIIKLNNKDSPPCNDEKILILYPYGDIKAVKVLLYFSLGNRTVVTVQFVPQLSTVEKNILLLLDHHQI